jgi:hypothetical protein
VSLSTTAGIFDQCRDALAASYGADDFLSVFRVQQPKSGQPVNAYPAR